jgi:carboxymethylenebutenolidase
MDGKTISISAANETFDVYLTTPPSGSGPGLVLMPETMGLGQEVRDLADFYAEEGYLVMVPDLFRHLQNGGIPLCERHLQLDMNRATGELDAVAAALHESSACTGKVAALGYCVGGTIACLALSRLSLDAAVAYCPTALDQHLDELTGVRRPLAIHFGADDNFVGADARASIKQAIAGDDAAETYVYPGAGHAFSDTSRHGLRRGAAAFAHSRTISLLRREIGPRYDLEALWEQHLDGEFVTCDAEATMRTMVDRPYVNHVPTMIGGFGKEQLYRYYKYHFIPQARGSSMIPVSRTVGADRLVDEFVACFTHDTPNDSLLPGVEPTGKYVELPMVAIVQFRGDKLCAERLYWDQASLLVQLGMLDPTQFPVTGAEAAAGVQDESVPLNTLRTALWWKKSEGQS